MQKIFLKYFISFLTVASLGSCIKNYNPPAIQNANNNYLVVDGFINAGPGQSSIFILSRTRNLGDSNTVDVPELNALVYIVSKSSGNSYPLLDSNHTGTYASDLLSLNSSDEYELKIQTTNGDQFTSDFVPVKVSAPIDSVTWSQNNNVSIFVSTHDPSNSSIYYKWDYVETWQHNAAIASYIQPENDTLLFSSAANPTQQIDSCWTSAISKSIITGTSIALTQDVIKEQPITIILQNDQKLAIRYSINVRQIPLTESAFNYWALIQKNSQQLGTLFDPQPSQLPSNIHSTVNPNEPVIGYLSAAVPQEKRMFISSTEISNWNAPPEVDVTTMCPVVLGTEPTSDFPIYTNPYPDPSFSPYDIGGTGLNATLTLTKTICLDCVYQGGTNIRPSFW